IVRDALQRGGKLIIPAFAIGRVEEVLYWLKRLEDERRIPVLPVFVDSPMAAAALQFYSSRLDELDADLATDPTSIRSRPDRDLTAPRRRSERDPTATRLRPDHDPTAFGKCPPSQRSASRSLPRRNSRLTWSRRASHRL